MEAPKLLISFLLLVMNQSVAAMTTRSYIPWEQTQVYQTFIEQLNGDMFPYCQELKSGGDKYACRLKHFPGVGFLFCKKAIIARDKCEDVLKIEIVSLQLLQHYGVNTVTFSWLIPNIICPDSTKHGTCSGFFENWVDEETGRFFHVRVYIDDETLDKKMTYMISETEKEHLMKTRDDLHNIEKFMMTEHADYFRCICDLQGFFLIAGGFLVSDTEGIEFLGRHKKCKHGGPTSAQFLFAVRFMIWRIDQAMKGPNAIFQTS